MSTDLETELRREFDAVRAPGSLTFSPDSVLRTGRRTFRRRRIIATCSAAMAVALVATGASLLTRPDDKAALQPAHRTATSGIVRAQVVLPTGTFQVDLNRDPSVESNVRYSVVTLDGKRHEVGGSSSNPKPGLKTVPEPDVTWGSGMVNGHPVTIGLVPGPARNLIVTFADGGSYGTGSQELKGTGYWMFAVDYTGANNKEAAHPVEIASVRWSGANGVVDGIEGDHRLTGRILTVDSSVSVEVVLRVAEGRRTTVSGQVRGERAGLSKADLEWLGYTTSRPMTIATTDPAGVAVLTGRQPIVTSSESDFMKYVGPPIAAGILPPGASDIGAILTTNEVTRGLGTQERLPDGSVIFAIKAAGAHPSQPSKDSVKAITWTNADGSKGRQYVTQQPGR